MTGRTAADVRRSPRPLGWLFNRSRTRRPCPTCGHTCTAPQSDTPREPTP